MNTFPFHCLLSWAVSKPWRCGKPAIFLQQFSPCSSRLTSCSSERNVRLLREASARRGASKGRISRPSLQLNGRRRNRVNRARTGGTQREKSPGHRELSPSPSIPKLSHYRIAAVTVLILFSGPDDRRSAIFSVQWAERNALSGGA